MDLSAGMNGKISNTSLPKARLRGKYTSKACLQCRQSKGKCSGGSICESCRRHGRECSYPARARMRKSSLHALHTSRLHGGMCSAIPAKDPRTFDSETERLRTRLASLEDQVSKMSKEHAPAVGTFHQFAPCETELFQSDLNQGRGTTLSSHIAAVKNVLPVKCIDLGSPPLQLHPLKEQRGLSAYLEILPAHLRLHRLVDLHFEYMNHFFPCIEEAEFRQELSKIDLDIGSSRDNLEHTALPISTSFLMLLFIVLAVGEYLDPQNQGPSGTRSAGWRYFTAARDISQNIHDTTSSEPSIGLLRYHTELAVYLIHVEKPTAAYRAIGEAIQLAFICRLNDEACWDCQTEQEKHAYRRLWWAVFYLDRRIAQKCWRPYVIRESEISVGELMTIEPKTTDIEADEALWDSRREYSALTDQYAQSNVRWAQLWTKLWDALFTPKAARTKLSIEELDVLDARIVYAERQVPFALQWDTLLAQKYADAAESELQVRSRLVVHVRFNLLRLILRQSWRKTMAEDSRGAQLCVELASDTINAVLAYMQTRRNVAPFGLNAIECVVEAMCHLVPHLRFGEKSSHAQLASSFRAAIQFLQKLAEHLGVARRALTALGEIADTRWLDFAEGVADTTTSLMDTEVVAGGTSLNDWFSSDWAEICLSLPNKDFVA